MASRVQESSWERGGEQRRLHQNDLSCPGRRFCLPQLPTLHPSTAAAGGLLPDTGFTARPAPPELPLCPAPKAAVCQCRAESTPRHWSSSGENDTPSPETLQLLPLLIETQFKFCPGTACRCPTLSLKSQKSWKTEQETRMRMALPDLML